MSNTIAPDKTLDQLIERTRMSSSLFARDLEAMSEEMLAGFPGGKARCAYDLVFEVVGVNRMIADHANGNGQDLPAPNGWVQAPTHFKVRENAIAEFKDSIDSLVMALAQLPPERFDELVSSPMGPMPLIRLAGIVPMHLMYHSGQLNYIQTFYGDDVFHWAQS